jgi:hypothetical protein
MNFLVWRRGLRGPSPALQDLDPRQLLSWEIASQETIAVIPLKGLDRALTLDQALAAHPCPTE